MGNRLINIMLALVFGSFAIDIYQNEQIKKKLTEQINKMNTDICTIANAINIDSVLKNAVLDDISKAVGIKDGINKAYLDCYQKMVKDSIDEVLYATKKKTETH